MASAGALATLHAQVARVQPGGTVTLFGRNYSNSPASSNIEIRLDERQGPIIASFSPRSMIGRSPTTLGEPPLVVGEPITIPAGTSLGTHTLIATQRNSLGTMVSGLAGRTTVEVTPSRLAGGAAGAPAEPASPGPMRAERLTAGGATRPALVLAVGLVLLALVLAARRRGPAAGRSASVRHAT